MEPLSTKSIDVGGIFLMDLSVNDSGAASSTNQCNIDDHQPASSGLSPHKVTDEWELPTIGKQLATKTQQLTSSMSGGYNQSRHHVRNAYRHFDYLCSSLDRLASVIDCDDQQQLDDEADLTLSNNICLDDERNVTLARPQQQPPAMNYHRDGHQHHGHHKNHHFHHNHNHHHHHHHHHSFTEAPSSFSDESYAASSDVSLSASFTGCSDDGDRDGCDKDSTTTREDSGVLDMKDLEVQLNSCNSCEEKNHQNNEAATSATLNIHQTSFIHSLEDKPAMAVDGSKNLTSTTDNSGRIYHNIYQQPDRPTDSSGMDSAEAHCRHHHHHHHLSSTNKRRVSASVPIQVPARQMRNDLNKMKLNLLKEEQAMEQDFALFGSQQQQLSQATDETKQKALADNNSGKRQDLAIFEDDDAFLEQEFNANHHNHYPVNEHGDENLTAKDDPMKLFASIQALARSLHEDTEIFGSLPPKRTLESPIRSMALV